MGGVLTPAQVRIANTIRSIGCSAQGWLDLAQSQYGIIIETFSVGVFEAPWE
jgi:hypothetical protein